ncbi:type IV pilus assembly protein PilM [Trichothermofontia sp.]
MINSLKGLFSKQSKGIGVELTADRINVAQLRRKGQHYTLQSFATIEVPEGAYQDGIITDPPEIAQLLQTVLAENRIKARKVATALPGREVVTRLIPVPAELPDPELREMVLNQEAGLYLPFPREEADVDYQKLGFFVDEDGIEKVQVLLVAVRKEVTDTYISTFREADLEIDTIEVTSFALLRSIRDQLRQFSPQEAIAVIDIEFDATEISIVVEGVPQFSRSVQIGTYQIQSALNRAMNLPPSRNTELLQGMTVPLVSAEGLGSGKTAAGANPSAAAMLRVLGELADELRRSVDFYVSQGENVEVTQLLIAGPGGGLGQIDEFFSQRLSLPSTQIDPLETLAIEGSEDIGPAQRSRMGTVLGLAMREA